MDDKSASPQPAAPPASAGTAGMAAPADKSQASEIAVPPEPRGADLRRAQRRAFPFRQRVAWGVWEGEPPEEAFVDVTFRDVSASGCSFLSAGRPEHDRLCLILGTESHRLVVEATVVHATPHKDEFGETHLVGCRFLKRLE